MKWAHIVQYGALFEELTVSACTYINSRFAGEPISPCCPCLSSCSNGGGQHHGSLSDRPLCRLSLLCQALFISSRASLHFFWTDRSDTALRGRLTWYTAVHAWLNSAISRSRSLHPLKYKTQGGRNWARSSANSMTQYSLSSSRQTAVTSFKSAPPRERKKLVWQSWWHVSNFLSVSTRQHGMQGAGATPCGIIWEAKTNADQHLEN